MYCTNTLRCFIYLAHQAQTEKVDRINNKDTIHGNPEMFPGLYKILLFLEALPDWKEKHDKKREDHFEVGPWSEAEPTEAGQLD